MRHSMTQSKGKNYDEERSSGNGYSDAFGSMVVFMIKWAIATIPAAIILFVLGAMLSGVLAGMAAGIVAAFN